MTKISKTVILGLVCTAFSALPLLAQTGNGGPSGAHYNLNIIGVEQGTNLPSLDNSNRHTIFVALNQALDTHSDIWLTQGAFQVCDGNAFDAAHDCTGAVIKPQGAVFQLPCNTEIPTDVGCVEGTVQAEYEVWVRELGTPGGTGTITLCAFDETAGEVVCNVDPNVVMLSRNRGRPTFRNVTDQLTVLHDTSQGNVSLFVNDFHDWVWQYSNQGLRLVQLRFYVED